MTKLIGQPSLLPSQAAVTPTGSRQETAKVTGDEVAEQAATSEPAKREGAPQPTREQVESATRDITDYMQSVSRSLQISVDDSLGTTIIRVLDAETDELVRQIPAEKAVEVARYLSDKQAAGESADPLRGLLVDKEG